LRPGINPLPSGVRPGSDGRPGIGRPGSPLAPGIAQLPNAGHFPSIGTPGIGSLPHWPGGSVSSLPGAGNRPDFTSSRPIHLPSQGTPQQRLARLQANTSQNRDAADRLERREQRREDRREDWQNNYSDIYQRHENWHHGFWHGHLSEWWQNQKEKLEDYYYDDDLDITLWGINRDAYDMGYWSFQNPFPSSPYSVGDDAVIDYSEPITVGGISSSSPGDNGTSEKATSQGMAAFDAARRAFKKGDYDEALAETNKALGELPNDPLIHEFRALVYFAQGNYAEAAAGLYSTLAAGPGSDWTTISSLYPSVEVYSEQLRALEAQIRKSPTSTDARFVLAYQYLTLGYQKMAVTQLKKLHQALPKDPIIQELLMMTDGPEAIAASSPAGKKPAGPAVSADDVVGSWTATRGRGNKFSMSLSKDGGFTWTFSQGGKPQTIKGVYTLNDGVLAMQPDDGGVTLAEVTSNESKGLHFRLAGAPPGDQGLSFVRSKS
jgi:tetratricopeptide (TPR) repeat protein